MQCVDCRCEKDYKVVMVRHGQSECNKENVFTGWLNAKLTEQGYNEAELTGKVLKEENYQFDVAYTSVLSRATVTLDIILNQLGQLDKIPVYKHWRLNERHYGDLTGLSKIETAKKFGADKVDLWRRSFNIPPPVMTKDHPCYHKILNDEIYEDGPDEFPMTESLKMTLDRIYPYWKDNIVPTIRSGKRVLICSHGNSLRAIVAYLDKLEADEIMNLHIPTGVPFFYIVNENIDPFPGCSLKYIGKPDYIKKALDDVQKLSKTKYK